MPSRGLSKAAIAATLIGGVFSVLGVLAFGGADADAYIYWADSQNRRIGRAANDGSQVNGSFVPATGITPAAVAVDAGHVYWINQVDKSIGRANIDGSAVNNSFITNVGSASGLAVNGSSIYWSTNEGPLGRAAIDGTGKNLNFIPGPQQSCGVAVDAGHVYWADIGQLGDPAYIGRAGLGGTNIETHFATIPGTSFPCGVAVNASNIYWSEPGIFGGGTRIGRANINGGGTADPSFIGDASAPCGIAVFGLQLFWSNAESNTIGRANTDATGVNQSFIVTGGNQICGIAVDALQPPPAPPQQPQAPQPAPPNPSGGPGPDVTPPQTTIVAGPGKRLAQGRAKFSFTSSEAGSTFECRIDGRKPSACRSPRAYSKLAAGRHAFRVWATDAAGNKAPTAARKSFRVPGPA